MNRVVGANNEPDPAANAEATPPASLAGRPANWRTAFRALGITTLPARNGYSAMLTAVLDTRLAVDGSAPGAQGVSGGAGRGPSGARSCMAAISSTLSIPSTTQWCNLRPIANAPCGTPGTEFSPSMTVISHGGRRRSICRAWMRAIWMHS